MTKSILKLSKNTSSIDVTYDISALFDSISGITIDHTAGITISTSQTLSFTVEGKTYLPTINDVEIYTAIKQKVDPSVVGVNAERITTLDTDKGKYLYVNRVPTVTRDLPPGFEELYKS